MPLIVYTAPIPFRGDDQLNITRKSAGPEGIIFAPSWRIVLPMIQARHAGDLAAQDAMWPAYVEAYAQEMKISQRAFGRAWARLLAQDSVTLICYCHVTVDRPYCHRILLARMLEERGAHYAGER